jgi:hypothetical protein
VHQTRQQKPTYLQAVFALLARSVDFEGFSRIYELKLGLACVHVATAHEQSAELVI